LSPPDADEDRLIAKPDIGHTPRSLVDAGTMVVIEHNLDVIKTADWIIEVGPEGGHAGGRILATGTPEQIAAAKTTATGAFLAEML
jgi:excinuclease ABC subunit A